MRTIVLSLALVLALVGCACSPFSFTPDPSASVAIEGVGDGLMIYHRVYFEDGSVFDLTMNHELLVRDRYPGEKVTGRLAKAVVEPVVGMRVTIRSAWDTIPGVVVAVEGKYAVVRFARMVTQGQSGSGVWVDGTDNIIGVLMSKWTDAEELTLVERPQE